MGPGQFQSCSHRGHPSVTMSSFFQGWPILTFVSWSWFIVLKTCDPVILFLARFLYPANLECRISSWEKVQYLSSQGWLHWDRQAGFSDFIQRRYKMCNTLTLTLPHKRSIRKSKLRISLRKILNCFVLFVVSHFLRLWESLTYILFFPF